VRQSRRSWQTANSPFLIAEVVRLGELAQLHIVNAGPGAARGVRFFVSIGQRFESGLVQDGKVLAAKDVSKTQLHLRANEAEAVRGVVICEDGGGAVHAWTLGATKRARSSRSGSSIANPAAAFRKLVGVDPDALLAVERAPALPGPTSTKAVAPSPPKAVPRREPYSTEHHAVAVLTADRWKQLAAEMQPADLALKKHFSIRPIDHAQAHDIVLRATTTANPGESVEVIEDALEIYERLRYYCNALDDFAQCVELGIYDEECAFALAGYRIRREFARYLPFIEVMRTALGAPAAYLPLERFVERFNSGNPDPGPKFDVNSRLRGEHMPQAENQSEHESSEDG
jgi:hypothetical protein